MLRVDLVALIGSLNSYCKHALEEASSFCISRGGDEVTVGHLLHKLAENPFSDVREILKSADLNCEQLHSLLTQNLPNSIESNDNLPAFSPLLIELLQEAWLIGSLELNSEQIRGGTVLLAMLKSPGRYLDSASTRYLSVINTEALRKDFDRLLSASGESEEKRSSAVGLAQKDALATRASALEKFGMNFTRLAQQGNIDPVLCRDHEIDMMIDILSRRRKNNPIAVGDAGVGKSALVEGLALRIHEGRVPRHLKQVQLWGLDIGALQAGASVKGEFEKRLKAVIEEVSHASVPIIVFIDEAHTLIGAGAQVGGSDAANLLKPALARGELRTIAATTWSEYKKYFEKDPALSRRFQLIKLEEPSVDDAVHILRGLQPVYETAHKVYITEDAIKAAARMSDRYISGRQLPDKAIDVLDTACARVATALGMPPRQVDKLNNRVQQIDEELRILDRDNRIGKGVDEQRVAALKQQKVKIGEQQVDLADAWKKQKEIVDQLVQARSISLETARNDDAIWSSFESREGNALLKVESYSPGVTPILPSPEDLIAELNALQQKQPLIHADVDEHQIASVIADWTGIPLNTITGDELERITGLPEWLGLSIKGQDEAIDTIHQHLLTAMADLRRQGRPLGAFLLVGPSGVGKTETAVHIAQQLFGGRQFMTVINMSEYQEKHTLSRLIGSPPGYVGFGEGGLLSEAIRQRPYSVVLLDEVEKAHPDVLNLFYQAFDKGEFADGEGRVIDCKNILFFLTSNIGFEHAVNADYDALGDDDLRAELVKFFRPALLARMQVVRYRALDDAALNQIVTHRLAALSVQFRERYGCELVLDDAIAHLLRARCVHMENGARMLDAVIEGELLPPLSLEVLTCLAEKKPMLKARLSVQSERFVAVVD